MAVYVFAILPLYAAPANTTPTLANLTFILDGQTAGAFEFNGSALSEFTSIPDPTVSDIDPTELYQSNVIVFQVDGLQNVPHNLNISVGADSAFLFDKVVYTTDDDSGDGATTTSSATQTSVTASQSSSSHR